VRTEQLIDTRTACKRLKVGSNYMAKIKREMGITGSRKFFLSDVVKHISARRQPPRLNPQPATVDTSDAQLYSRALETSLLLTHGH
jgi:uncharacterized protein (DUF2132 family)